MTDTETSTDTSADTGATDFSHRMSDADQLMWTVEKDPLLRSTITTVILLDKAPKMSVVRERLERGSRVIPRLRQRVRSNPLSVAPPRWENDINFDLNFHVRKLRAPGKGTIRDVLDLAEPIAMEGFDRARPLWQFHVVNGLAGGGAALIIKLHHAVTDGVGGMALMLEILDLERSPKTSKPMPLEPEARAWTQVERFLDATSHEVRRGGSRAQGLLGTSVTGFLKFITDPNGEAIRLGETVSSAARMLEPAPEPLSPVMVGRSLSQHFELFTVPLDQTKAAARTAGGKLNDAFLAGIAGGISRYHQRHGAIVDSVRLSMPINTRSAESQNQAGNQFAPARFQLPLEIEDPVERMENIRGLVGRSRAEPALALTDTLAAVLNRLPTSVTTEIFGSMLRGMDLVASNVPGAPFDVYFCGGRLTAQYAFGPMAGAAVNITLISHNGDLNIGINTDPAAVRDPEVLRECLEEGFEELLDLT
jgi:WS/DGAT/MGAT family acyltransferase